MSENGATIDDSFGARGLEVMCRFLTGVSVPVDDPAVPDAGTEERQRRGRGGRSTTCGGSAGTHTD